MYVKRGTFLIGWLCILVAIFMVCALPSTALAANSKPMYRLYNRYTGEHFYTDSANERAQLNRVGWIDEGIGWIAPEKSNTPVYRLYNRYVPGGDHHYTTSASERDACIAKGWIDEGVGWYSDDSKTVPLYRQYNPNAKTGTHNYSTSKNESDHLVSLGWRYEGVAWYGANGSQAGHQHSWVATQITEPIYGEASVYKRKTTAYCDCGLSFSSFEDDDVSAAEKVNAHQKEMVDKYRAGEINQEELEKHMHWYSKSENIKVGTKWDVIGTTTRTVYKCSECGAIQSAD